MIFSVRPKQVLSMQTRDRIQLDADVYYPDAAGEFPVLLMRQPYGRAIASTVVYAHPIWYAAHGYIVVIQDVRGRGTSAGTFRLFEHEVEDGYDTVEWAASLPQSNGSVGMYGFSYQGMTQLYAAAAQPTALKTICPSMIAHDLYADWAYEGGAFCHLLNLAWALQLSAETLRRTADSAAYESIYSAAHQIAIANPINLHSPFLQQVDPDSFYHTWVEQSQPSPYWEKLSPVSLLQEIDLPMLHIGGWFDTYLRGTWNLYRDRTRIAHTAQHLIIGPWIHLPWGQKVGAMDYGIAANNPIDQLQVRWFDQFLKGIETGILQEPPITLFELGSNQWRKFSDLNPALNPALDAPLDPTLEATTAPQAHPLCWHLTSNGLAAMRLDAGQLVISSEASDRPFAIPDIWVHDPWRPVPAVGGHAAFPAGAGDRSAIDCRTDVVTYTTEPLSTELHLIGEIEVKLTCAADAFSFDLCAVLSEVYPNGTAINFSQGYIRIPSGYTPHTPIPVSISLQPICIRLASGNALRLSFSGACSPAYSINSGTGIPSSLIDAKVITLSLSQGKLALLNLV